MTKPINRREFIKLSSLGLGTIAIKPFHRMLPPEGRTAPVGIGRVTVSSIGVFKEPNLKSERLRIRQRDDLVTLKEDLISPHGPQHN
ncbi:MAG: hypothetical protein ABUK20_13790, partial [Anaerolineales bacterium]